MNRLLIVAILILSTALLCAHGQQQNVAKLKEDARNAVGIIGANRGKTRTYCEIVDLLGRQLDDQEKDKKKTKSSLQRVDQLQKKLGPEYVVLENILRDIDLKSPDGREIALIIQSLNESVQNRSHKHRRRNARKHRRRVGEQVWTTAAGRGV